MRKEIQRFFQKGMALFAISLLGIFNSLAQSSAGIDQATSEVSSYIDPVANLIIAIGAVVGLIGGVRVYIKWQSGDQDTQKAIMGWFGACLFLILVGVVIRGLLFITVNPSKDGQVNVILIEGRQSVVPQLSQITICMKILIVKTYSIQKIDTNLYVKGFSGQLVYSAMYGIIADLLLFVLLYILLGTFVSVLVCVPFYFAWLYRLHQIQKKYGHAGWDKKKISKQLPEFITIKKRFLR